MTRRRPVLSLINYWNAPAVLTRELAPVVLARARELARVYGAPGGLDRIVAEIADPGERLAFQAALRAVSSDWVATVVLISKRDDLNKYQKLRAKPIGPDHRRSQASRPMTATTASTSGT